MDGDIDAIGRYQRMTQNSRAAGIRAEMFQGNSEGIGNQMKYADRRGCPIAVIQGGDERAQGVVPIKDLVEGKRLSGEIEDNASWREARVAQETVAEDERCQGEGNSGRRRRKTPASERPECVIFPSPTPPHKGEGL